MASDYDYRLKYVLQMKPGHWKVPDAEAPNTGLTDALFVASILYPPDGSYSLHFWSADGRDACELSDHEIFKMWAVLANRLGRSRTLDPWRRKFAEDTFRDYFEAVSTAVDDAPINPINERPL